MTGFVLKADPFTIRDDGVTQVTLPAFYGGNEIAAGDRCYLWFSEKAGGGGLTGSGTVRDVTAQGRHRTVELKLDHCIRSQISVADLRPFRDDARSPQGLIARKLYKHAHNKIAKINAAEAAYLDSFLTPRP